MDLPLPGGFTCQPWGLLGARQTFLRWKGTQEGEAWVPVQMVYIQVPGEIEDMVICALWSGDGEIFHLTPCVRANSLQLRLTLCNPMDCSPSAPLSMGFLRQEYWSGLPCPPPGPPDSSALETCPEGKQGVGGLRDSSSSLKRTQIPPRESNQDADCYSVGPWGGGGLSVCISS